MAFISKTDLFAQILPDELDEITRGDDTLVEAMIVASLSEIETYLHINYNTAEIFAETGADRYQLLVRLASDITIWHLIASGQPGQNYDDRYRRYKNAIEWLKMAAKTTNLPELPNTDNVVSGGIIYGANTKRSNYY